MIYAVVQSGIVNKLARSKDSTPTYGLEYVAVPTTVDPETGEELTDVRPGWTYDGAAFAAPGPRQVSMTPVSFKLRFTSAERATIRASTNPATQDFLAIIDDPRLKEVVVGDTFTTDAVNYLEAEGLIAAGRAAEILGT